MIACCVKSNHSRALNGKLGNGRGIKALTMVATIWRTSNLSLFIATLERGIRA